MACSTLTAAQLLDIRLIVGDSNDAQDAGLVITDDTVIQGWYDDNDCDLEQVYIAYLRRLVGYYGRKTVNVTDDFGRREVRDPLFKAMQEQLAYWESVAGQSGGQTVTTSAGIVWRRDSSQTEEPDFN